MTRVALVGCGAHGLEHATALAALRRAGRDVKLALVVDPVPGRAQEFAARHGVPRHATELGAIDDRDVDAVDVCAPTDAHAAAAAACAAAGKPALIEKPLAPTLPEAERIVAAFAAAGVPLFPGHSSRFDPVCRRFGDAVAGGALGRLGLLAIHHYQGYPWPGGWRAWQLDPRRSGGRIVHLGIHDIDLACWLAGERPVRVRAIGTPEPSAAGVDWRSYELQLTFAGGAIAQITAEWRAEPPELLRKTIALVAENGQLRYDSGHDELLASTTRPRDRMAGYEDGIRGQLAHWLDCVDGAAEPLVTPTQALVALRAAFAADASARDGGAVVELAGEPHA